MHIHGGNEGPPPRVPWPPLGQAWGQIEDVAGGDALRFEFSTPVSSVAVSSTSNYEPGSRSGWQRDSQLTYWPNPRALRQPIPRFGPPPCLSWTPGRRRNRHSAPDPGTYRRRSGGDLSAYDDGGPAAVGALCGAHPETIRQSSGKSSLVSPEGKSLEGKSALVTGGTRGIGLAITRAAPRREPR